MSALVKIIEKQLDGDEEDQFIEIELLQLEELIEQPF